MTRQIRYLIYVLFCVSVASAQNQHIEKVKSPGEPVIIDFWSLPDSSTFDGIVLELATAIEGPYVDTVLSLQKDDHSITFPAPLTPTFYRIYYFKMVNGEKQRSLPSNSVAIFIVNTGLPAQ